MPDAAGTADTVTMSEDAAPDAAAPPLTFHCGFNAQCPEVTIVGDPHSTDDFHGYGDPTLEKDPSGTLWLGYSWLDNQLLNATEVRAVRTHLAQSTDGGSTFTFEKAINVAAPAPANAGYVVHEVSTLAHKPDGNWHHAWLTYAITAGGNVEHHYQRTTAPTPSQLGTTSDAWLRGIVTTTPTQLDESQIAGAENCAAFTEPSLFTHGAEIYLATTCIVDGTPATQRLILLRESGNSLVVVGDLLDYEDAVELGATRLEQIDLALATDGAILAIITPIDDAATVIHRGCVVLEVANLATAQMRRTPEGKLRVRAILTADGNGIGPGLCTYDKDSSTGILMVLTSVAAPQIAFSLRATGIHP